MADKTTYEDQFRGQYTYFSAMDRIVVGDTSLLYCIIGRKWDNDPIAA
jgi:hypothetical protein